MVKHASFLRVIFSVFFVQNECWDVTHVRPKLSNCLDVRQNILESQFSQDICRSSLSKYSSLDLRISLTTSFRKILYLFQKISASSSSELTIASLTLPNQSFDVACYPRIVTGFNCDYLSLYRLLSCREYRVCYVLNVLIDIAKTMNFLHNFRLRYFFSVFIIISQLIIPYSSLKVDLCGRTNFNSTTTGQWYLVYSGMKGSTTPL